MLYHVINQYFSPFYGWVIFDCINTFYLFMLSCSHLLAVVNSIAGNMCIQAFVAHLFSVLSVCLGGQLLSHQWLFPMFRFWRTDKNIRCFEMGCPSIYYFLSFFLCCHAWITKISSLPLSFAHSLPFQTLLK